MKTLLIVICTLLIGLFLLVIGGAAVGMVWYTWPTPEPVISFATAQVIEVEVPYEVVVTEIVEVERVITATPEPTSVQLAEENANVLHTQIATEDKVNPYVQCTDGARIESQPISDIQSGKIEIGKKKRMTWVIQNVGTCVWDGYTWESTEDPLVLAVPYTEPGYSATITYDVIASEPMSLRMFLMAPSRAGLLGFGNTNTTDGGAVYRMEIYGGNSTGLFRGADGSYWSCGPGG